MKIRSGKLLFVLLIYFFVQQSVLVHSSTEDPSNTARSNGVLEEPNHLATIAESPTIAVDSHHDDSEIADENSTVPFAPTRENPIAEEPSDSEVETDGSQNNTPGVATLILFCIVIAWLTTAGAPKEG